MVAYNVAGRFASAVESGVKTTTIRQIRRRRHAKPGERIQLYTGMRSKQCRKLVDPDPVCTRVVFLDIDEARGVAFHSHFDAYPWWVFDVNIHGGFLT